jgi:hypothetical protein
MIRWSCAVLNSPECVPGLFNGRRVEPCGTEAAGI